MSANPRAGHPPSGTVEALSWLSRCAWGESGLHQDSLVGAVHHVSAVVERNRNLLEAAEKLDKALSNVLPEFGKLINDAGPCDHDVGLCVCGLEYLATEGQEALAEYRAAKEGA